MDPFTTDITIFVLAVFVGYYVVWSVTPALHTPLMHTEETRPQPDFFWGHASYEIQ